MDLNGGVIHNEGRLKGWALKSRLFWALHCEKSLFVLASRQKIPVLRTENTRTICLPPIEFFKIPHARKATAGKFRPRTTDTAGKSRPSGPWRETFYIPMPEKLRPENPSKQLQIPPVLLTLGLLNLPKGKSLGRSKPPTNS